MPGASPEVDGIGPTRALLHSLSHAAGQLDQAARAAEPAGRNPLSRLRRAPDLYEVHRSVAPATGWAQAEFPGTAEAARAAGLQQQVGRIVARAATGGEPDPQALRTAAIDAMRLHDVIRGIELAGGSNTTHARSLHAGMHGIPTAPWHSPAGNQARIARAARLAAEARESADAGQAAQAATLLAGAGRLTQDLFGHTALEALPSALLHSERLHPARTPLLATNASRALGSFISGEDVRTHVARAMKVLEGPGGLPAVDASSLRASAAGQRAATVEPATSIAEARGTLAGAIDDWSSGAATDTALASSLHDAAGALSHLLPDEALDAMLLTASRTARGTHGDHVVGDMHALVEFLDQVGSGARAPFPQLGGGSLAGRLDDVAAALDEVVHTIGTTSHGTHGPIITRIEALADGPITMARGAYEALGSDEARMVADELDTARQALWQASRERYNPTSPRYEHIGEAQAAVSIARSLSMLVDDGSRTTVDGAALLQRQARQPRLETVESAIAVARNDLEALGVRPPGRS